MSLRWRLVVGSGRAAVARLLLVVLGTAVGAALLLLALGVATVQTEETAVTGAVSTVVRSDGTVERLEDPGSSGPLSSPYFVEPELRRGVVIGVVLCVVPLLVFVAVASRVAARQREERLAALRLAGATAGQVRVLAALDTAVATGCGVVLGALAFVVGREVARALLVGEAREVATVVAPPPAAALLVLVVLVAVLAVASALALRALRITPLGVVRRAPRRRPRPWGLLLLLLGLGVFYLLGVRGVPNSASGDASLGASLAVAMLGLVTCGPWLVSLTGTAAVRVGRGPAWLLAGRRLEDEPRAQARALTPVVLVVLAATIAVVVLGDFRRNDADEDFYATGFRWAFAGMLLSLVVGAAGLLLTTLEGLLERRTASAAMVAVGASRATLRRAVLLQVALPVVPAGLLAVATGTAVVIALGSGEVFASPPPSVLLLVPAAALVSAAAAALTLPTLRRTADPEQLRMP